MYRCSVLVKSVSSVLISHLVSARIDIHRACLSLSPTSLVWLIRSNQADPWLYLARTLHNFLHKRKELIHQGVHFINSLFRTRRLYCKGLFCRGVLLLTPRALSHYTRLQNGTRDIVSSMFDCPAVRPRPCSVSAR